MDKEKRSVRKKKKDGTALHTATDKMKEIRFAIFDMDGTLVDSMTYWNNLLDEFFAIVCPNTPLSDELRVILQKMTTAEIEQYMREHGLADSSALEGGGERCLAIMRGHYEKDVPLRAGVRELLEQLRQNGVRMGIATLTERSLVEVCLKRHGIDGYFEFLYTANEYPEGKKGTRVFLDAAKHFAAPTEEIWLFEDSFYSVQTAKTLGMPIAVTEDEDQRENFGKLYEVADMYFKNGFTERVK